MELKEYIASGILEMYVLGQTTEEERLEVENMMLKHNAVLEEVADIRNTLEKDAIKNAITPHETIKPLLMATMRYMSRLEAGEEMVFAPELNANSKIEDFKEWIDKDYMAVPEEFDNLYLHIITGTPELTCAVVWIKNLAPDEVHHDEREKFLILEGTCTIMVGDQENKLVPGDYFEIPMYENHQVIVTSEIPCKVILQRIAA